MLKFNRSTFLFMCQFNNKLFVDLFYRFFQFAVILPYYIFFFHFPVYNFIGFVSFSVIKLDYKFVYSRVNLAFNNFILFLFRLRYKLLNFQFNWADVFVFCFFGGRKFLQKHCFNGNLLNSI